MELRAILTQEDVAQALVRIAPLRLHFTPEDEDTRWIQLERPSDAHVIEGQGLSVTCPGRLRYKVKGVKFEVNLHSIRLLVRPQVLATEEHAARLNFRLTIEELDIEHVPGLIDKMIQQAIDAALTPRTTELFWNFGETLTSRFRMPGRLEPIESLGLEVAGGDFLVTKDQLELHVHFKPLQVVRSAERPSDDQLRT